IVPVTLSADRLGQTTSRGGDDRPRGLEREEFERQGRAMDHLPPATLVGALREPAPPVGDGVAKHLFRLAGPGTWSGGVLRTKAAQGERDVLPFLQGEVGDHPVALALQRQGGS